MPARRNGLALRQGADRDARRLLTVVRSESVSNAPACRRSGMRGRRRSTIG
jgi:hypothetical protein